MKRNLKFFSNLSIRYKLFASYVVVITIPFLILLSIHIHTTQKENTDAAFFAAQKMLEETKSYLQYKSQAIIEILNYIAFDSLVQSSVAADSKSYEDINSWHMNALQLTRLINQFRYNEDIEKIQLYMKRGLAGATENIDFMNLSKLEASPWFQPFKDSNVAFGWFSSSFIDKSASDQEITVMRKVPNSHNIQQFDGIVSGRIKKDAMQSVLNHAIFTPHSTALLFNEHGDLLSSSIHFPLEANPIQDIYQIYQLSGKEVYWNEAYSIHNKRYLLGVRSIPHSDMKVALIVPYSDILDSSIKARNRIIFIYLWIIPFAFPLSFVIAASASKRILRLISYVRKVKHGNFQVAPLPANEDEIGELTRNFNGMVNNISNLMDETYLLGREVKNQELKALQAQINPHFLYNTLDLINVMAIESGTSDISKVVMELATFYKLSLSNGDEYVTLESELKHVEAYVRIQNMRFGHSILLQLEVSRDLYAFILPKILLQPLVENAIIHGIMEKEPEQGTIRISARMENSDILIAVEDDGIGMDQTRIADIYKGNSSKAKGGGYGVRNIEERLKLAFGAAYGLKFESVLNKGTCVVIRIPAQETRREISLEIQR
ncbi:sensor histidine kinase [Paenibacillus psychroresistens]|uniref:histidine kinase n=1 Tax=Paenibacillus psychroresistens TaxID=1778678 RepID=A0A6B8RI49_9BACL|nr:sensor histidine kinase [Paenibacillus psychroresistens]QGQ95920.1 sensor histidine kinase [Paenibacillus psychroresistens]